MTSDDLFVVVIVILHKICHTCGMTHASAAIHKQKHHRDILERRVLPLRWEKLQKKVTQKILQQLPLTCALKGFFLWFKHAVWWMSINRYHGFHTLAKRRFFPPFLSTRRNMLAFNRFCNILLQDVTLLHVKITRSTNLLSVCRRKLKLSTYLHTVSYKHISFLSTHSQLLSLLASSEFYSITWRMVSRSAGYKIYFRKQPSVRGNVFPLSVWYLSFLWISTPWQFIHGSRVFIQSDK